ncbi:hypothetical protein AVEN_164184-1, partial [Araneus ventricosus]
HVLSYSNISPFLLRGRFVLSAAGGDLHLPSSCLLVSKVDRAYVCQKSLHCWMG